MMKRFVSIISEILLVCLICAIIVPNAMAAEENNVQTKLNSVLDDFPIGSYFTTDGQRGSSGDLLSILRARGVSTRGFDQSKTCVGFAKYVWAKVFGHSITAPYRVKIDYGRASDKDTWSNAKPGDLIYFNSKPSKPDSCEHAAIVWSVSSTDVTILDCNYGNTNQISVYTATFGSKSNWARTYCSIYRANNYDEIGGVITNTCIINFDPNGGDVWPASKTLTAGTLLTGMPTPTRSGYRFLGWAMDKIDPDGKTPQSTAIVSDGVYTFNENTTLYALWAKEPNASQGLEKPASFDYSGTFGVNNALSWGLNTSTGVLVLSGNGKMQNWSNAENRPWANLRNTVIGVLIEDGVQNIGQYAVARCENMTGISIPESVTEIGDGAFIDVYSLKSLELPNSLTKIGTSAFSGCISLKNITIPKNVDFIETGAFSGCTNLESIYFCGNAPSYFGDNGIVRLNMFSGCRNLTVYYPANSSGWTPIIEKYTDVTWKTWDTGDTTPSNGSSGSTQPSVSGPWSEWSTTPYSASSTRQVETRQVKVSDAYTEYRYGLWRNTNNASWCPEYGATFSPSGGSWYESYSAWSTTPMYDTGHNAYCAGSNHTHTHISGYDSNGWANWDIYSADGTFTGWNRLYYYWEETRTVPAVYETQYRYRDLASE